MKAWLVTANDSYLWFPTQDDAEGYAQTLIADFATRDSCRLVIEKYSQAGDTNVSLVALLNGHCETRRVFEWVREGGQTVLYSRAKYEIRVNAHKPNHPTPAHAEAVLSVISDPSLLELASRANNHTEWILFTSALNVIPRRLATYVWFYIKGRRMGSQ